MVKSKLQMLAWAACLRKEEGDIDQYSLGTFNKYGVSIVLAGRAPEIIAGRPLTPAADIWAMGPFSFTSSLASISPSHKIQECFQRRRNLERPIQLCRD